MITNTNSKGGSRIRIPFLSRPVLDYELGPNGALKADGSGNWGPACGDSERREENSDKMSFSAFFALRLAQGRELVERRLRGEIVFG